MLLCREGSHGSSGSIPALGLSSPSLTLPSAGHRAAATGLCSRWLLDSSAHHVAKVTEKGGFSINIPISSPSLEQASPAVSGMSDDPAGFLTHCTGRFWALAHKHFSRARLEPCEQSHWLKREHLAQVQRCSHKCLQNSGLK